MPLTVKATAASAIDRDLNGSKGTIFDAFRAMQEDGRMVIDDTRKPKVCHLVRNQPEGQEPGF